MRQPIEAAKAVRSLTRSSQRRRCGLSKKIALAAIVDQAYNPN
jgi:hypothetical protein